MSASFHTGEGTENGWTTYPARAPVPYGIPCVIVIPYGPYGSHSETRQVRAIGRSSAVGGSLIDITVTFKPLNPTLFTLPILKPSTLAPSILTLLNPKRDPLDHIDQSRPEPRCPHVNRILQHSREREGTENSWTNYPARAPPTHARKIFGVSMAIRAAHTLNPES